MSDLISRILKADITRFTDLSFETYLGLILIIQALFAIGTGKLSQFISNRTLMIMSLGTIAAGLGLWSLNMGAIALLGYLVRKSATMLSTSGSILITTIVFLSAGLGIALGSRIANVEGYG